MDDKEAPSAKSLSGEGYNQTYVIMSQALDGDAKISSDAHEVFFRCGNWCYKGQIQFAGLKIAVSDLPLLIPTLQRQQGSLRYYCTSVGLPKSSEFYEPVEFLREALDFIGEELVSERVDNEIRRMSSIFPWINDDSASTYFELSLSNVPSFMKNVGIIASKTYTRGLVIMSIYYDSTLYFVLEPGDGDQALLDVRFPNVSRHGQGLLLACYNDHTVSYRKLTLWHCIDTDLPMDRPVPKLKTLSIASRNYEQTYCVMQSEFDRNAPNLSVHHDVLFRFGSWCYSGRVQLTPSLTLADIPFVIPALRMQQSRLDYVFDTSSIPVTSPFAAALDFANRVNPLIEQQIADSEEALRALIVRLEKMGLGESISRWLEGDSANSFFEFKLCADAEMLKALENIELVASKCYHPSGIVTITVIFQNAIYVTVLESGGENPLLDSKFPDVSGKGRGYQIQAYSNGTDGWPSLRKVSVWQTVTALEKEFRERASLIAQSKSKELDPEQTNNDASSSKDGTMAGNFARQLTFEAPVANLNNNSSSSSPENETPGSLTPRAIQDQRRAALEDSDDRFASSANSLVSSQIKYVDDDEEEAIQRRMVDSSTPSKAEDKDASRRTGSTPATAHRLDKASGSGGDFVAGNGNTPATPSLSSLGGGCDGIAAAGAKNAGGDAVGVASPSNTDGGIYRVARPHHLPKLDSLSKRMDEIRRTMGSDQSGSMAPWDAFGKPLKLSGDNTFKK